jgi:hypothetical protein
MKKYNVDTYFLFAQGLGFIFFGLVFLFDEVKKPYDFGNFQVLIGLVFLLGGLAACIVSPKNHYKQYLGITCGLALFAIFCWSVYTHWPLYMLWGPFVLCIIGAVVGFVKYFVLNDKNG